MCSLFCLMWFSLFILFRCSIKIISKQRENTIRKQNLTDAFANSGKPDCGVRYLKLHIIVRELPQQSKLTSKNKVYSYVLSVLHNKELFNSVHNIEKMAHFIMKSVRNHASAKVISITFLAVMCMKL